jgi:membrane protease YdiL (CAAX protease family)
MLALWTGDLVAVLLLPGAVLVVLVVALAVARARDRVERVVPEASASGLLGAAALALLAVGAVAGLWAALIGACVRYSRRRGSDDLRSDFGWQVRWRDLWRGFGVFWIGVCAVGLVESFITDPRYQGTNTEVPRHFKGDTAGFLLVAIITAVGAPLVEELFFRGLLLRGLTGKFGTRPAVLLQAVVFGLAHVNPLQGTHNVSVLAFAFTLGIVLGWAAIHFRSLGPGMVAHGIQNTLAMVVVLTTR